VIGRSSRSVEAIFSADKIPPATEDEIDQAKRTCPPYGSEKYLSRGRKTISAENGQEKALDTKYRCKARACLDAPSAHQKRDVAGLMQSGELFRTFPTRGSTA
jgi:hypothetical protein